ncbi:MAG: CDP-alcohol phosphatidyltransferase family protein [Bacteroidota bacterium]|nr:CDP-alcohol phosphatidyltransferase family protein [Bacteroidota bacterium]
MQKLSYKIINGITIYRIVITPILIYFILTRNINVFKWLLALSFFTDLIDGYLARTFKVTSILGSKLDSIGDDLTILSGIFGLYIFRFDFLKQEILGIGILLSLFLFQNILALIKYKKITSFHTYLAKISAVFQGVFLILAFFLDEPNYLLYNVTLILTGLDLIEEIILVIIIPKWEINVKGLYWVLKKLKAQKNNSD